MGRTVVEGDAAFLKGLDPDFVARDLVDDRFVAASLKKYPEALAVAAGSDPLVRTEVLKL